VPVREDAGERALGETGDDSALFGLTALAAAGLRGQETVVQHVVAPHGRGRRDLQTDVVRIEVHESLDADFEPWLVTVEINGAQHLSLLHKEADDERRFVLASGTRLVVDIASYLVRHHIDRCVLRTARALSARGWQPEPRVHERLETMARGKGKALWLPDVQVPATAAVP
jgi:hypothetical protein